MNIKFLFLSITLGLLSFFNTAVVAQQDFDSLGMEIFMKKEVEKSFKKKKRKENLNKFFKGKLRKQHSTTKATLWALLPGGGQIYNGKYWKLPLVYGGFGALGYLTYQRGKDFYCLRKAYIHQNDNDTNTNYTCSLVSDQINQNSTSLLTYRDNAQRDFELAVTGLSIFFVVTIVDAFIDAHLLTFDIDDDLSISLGPTFDMEIANLEQMNFQNLNTYFTDMSQHRFIPGLGISVRPRNKKRVKPTRFNTKRF